MNKYIYVGQKWTAADVKVGNGSVYIGGPRNRKGKSWRVDFINKLAEIGITGSLFIPEGPGQLKGGFCRIDKDEKNKWQKFAAASASAIVFWFPSDASDDIGALDLKAWYKSDRVFIGKDPSNTTAIVDEISKEPNIIISDSLDGVVERVSVWLNRE
jgi:hypothetical protein